MPPESDLVSDTTDSLTDPDSQRPKDGSGGSEEAEMEGTIGSAHEGAQLALEALRRDVAEAKRRAGEPCRGCGGTRRVQAWDTDAGQLVEAVCGECLYVQQG